MPMLFPELSYKVVGAAMAVHRELGSGFMEKVYQEALAIEMAERGMSFQRELPIHIAYHGHVLACPYIADFIVDNRIIIELKALSDMDKGKVKAQVLNYLKATHLQLGIILNFGEESLFMDRVVNFEEYNKSRSGRNI